MGSDHLVPPWLNPMLEASYFTPCPGHGGCAKSECYKFCLDCMGNALCRSCTPHHRGHQVVQIRRSSSHSVVPVNEIQKYLNISGIQTYINNYTKTVLLYERPQRRPGKGVKIPCQICCRSLPDSFHFCSLRCKLNAMKKGDADITFTVKAKHSRDSLVQGDPRPRRRRSKGHSSFSGDYQKSDGREESKKSWVD